MVSFSSNESCVFNENLEDSETASGHGREKPWVFLCELLPPSLFRGSFCLLGFEVDPRLVCSEFPKGIYLVRAEADPACQQVDKHRRRGAWENEQSQEAGARVPILPLTTSRVALGWSGYHSGPQPPYLFDGDNDTT